MPSYLLIESRDPYESRSFLHRCNLAAALAADGATVTLFLVENGVLAARSAAGVPELDKAQQAGVAVLADAFALRERGITTAEISAHVRSVDLDALVERLGAGARAIWS